MSGFVSGKILKISVFLIVLSFCISFFAAPIHGQDVDYPDYTGYVNDFAEILDSASRHDLESLITGIEKNTGAEIAVVTIDTLEGITIEEYAVKLFEKWGIGKADKDNGLLILVSLMDRKVRIEVGYGLEGIITDLEAGRIIDEIIVPNFKNEDYSRGIYNAVVTISNQIYGEEELGISGESREDYSSGSNFSFPGGTPGCICCFPVFIGIFLIIFLVNLFKRRCPKCRRYWALTIKTKILKAATYASSGKKEIERTCKYCSFHDKKIVKIPRRTKSSSSGSGGGWSGGSSGGSSSFGGGSSGGGGASGSW
ncbi:MAG: TPM domain-containing protein [Actinomycetia bacterium]|nr:TPM domain-containing protein [Actinomycetes bacterium]